MLTPLTSVLDRTIQLLDISLEQQELAIARYDHLGAWLTEEQKGRAGVRVYPQGSFRLGTVVRPADLGGDFDIDLVFLRELSRSSISQEDLKAQAGQLLTRYSEAFGIDLPIELGRCWRLDFFDEGFHLDVLPVIPDEEVDDGILLSDRDFRLWLYSNPIGYADWFYDRMNHQLFEDRLEAVAKALGRDVDKVPRFFVRTPLQRVVQLLKRSRDEHFARNPDERPASILITTLAARAYRGQAVLEDALREVIDAMPNYIENRSGAWWVENPAHPGENFADKWNTHPGRRELFFEWLAEAGSAVGAARQSRAVERVGELLKASFGGIVAEAATSLVDSDAGGTRKAATGERRAPKEQFIEDRFPVHLEHEVVVAFDVAEESSSNRYHRRRAEHSRRLGKHRSLRFAIERTSVPPPFDVYWKVRNFGREAATKGGLRGELMPDDGSHVRSETTLYRGEHYIECYIVKSGACLARARTWVPIE